MPRAVVQQPEHREKLKSPLFPACVARRVPRSEWGQAPHKAALDKLTEAKSKGVKEFSGSSRFLIYL